MIHSKVEFLMLVGLPGSGKSTYAEEIKEYKDRLYESIPDIDIKGCHIHSSDAIRKELYGSEECQDDPARVFNLMLSRTIEDLNNRCEVIYDATNLNRKKRMAVLEKIKKIPNVTTTCAIIFTPLEECIIRCQTRERKVEKNIIYRMLKSFDIPVKGEGWNDILLRHQGATRLLSPLPEQVFMRNCLGLEHQNPHHKLDVGAHSCAAVEYLKRHYPERFEELKTAVFLHDIGKALCKTFTNRKGETTEAAHFYQHANVGSYLALGIFYVLGDNALEIATLIGFHMRPLEAWEESKKAKEKDAKLLGPELMEKLEILSECDRNCEDNL